VVERADKFKSGNVGLRRCLFQSSLYFVQHGLLSCNTKQPEHSSRHSYRVTWTIVTHCFTYGVSHGNIRKVQSVQNAAARLLTGTRRGDHIRQCCANCTSFQSSDESTSNWRVLSSHHCLARHLRTWLTTYIWSRKGLDAGSARLTTDRVLFHAHTTHSVTGALLLPWHVSGTASQQTYATRTLPTRVSGLHLKRTGFLAAGAQCDILLNCAIQIALLN